MDVRTNLAEPPPPSRHQPSGDPVPCIEEQLADGSDHGGAESTPNPKTATAIRTQPLTTSRHPTEPVPHENPAMGDLVAVVLGLAVGLALGALGGGGSTLAVPVLVFVAGLSAQEATSASLLVVGISAAVGVASHLRQGDVRLKAGVGFGAAGILGAAAGTAVNRRIDGDLLLLLFAALIAFVAVRMFRGASAPRAEADPTPGPGASGGTTARSGVVAPVRSASTHSTTASVARFALAATGVGFLTGLFGVGGGFAVVPALVLLLHVETRTAIGTSLVVIAINAAVALALRIGSIELDWRLVGPFLATVTIGVLAGSLIAARTDARILTRAFAVMLGLIALYTGASPLWG